MFSAAVCVFLKVLLLTHGGFFLATNGNILQSRERGQKHTTGLEKRTPDSELEKLGSEPIAHHNIDNTKHHKVGISMRAT